MRGEDNKCNKCELRECNICDCSWYQKGIVRKRIELVHVINVCRSTLRTNLESQRLHGNLLSSWILATSFFNLQEFMMKIGRMDAIFLILNLLSKLICNNMIQSFIRLHVFRFILNQVMIWEWLKKGSAKTIAKKNTDRRKGS